MVWLITALRCVVFPLGFLAALYFLPLDRTLCMAILILASCPAGSLTAVLAKQYDTEGELASQAVAHSTLSILISVPLVLSLGSTLLGIKTSRFTVGTHRLRNIFQPAAAPVSAASEKKKRGFFLWQMSTISSRK